MKTPFTPFDLPNAKMVNTNAYLPVLIRSVRTLESFNSELKNTKANKQHLIFHLANREAFYSSKIEGTNTTFEEFYKASAEKESETNATAEVLRYVKALEYSSKCIQNGDPISTRLFLQTHKILLGGPDARGSGSTAGLYRTAQVYVGEHTPPPANLVENCMNNLENYINNTMGDDTPELVRVSIIHAQFETIHPFFDGNGRMGRVLIPLFLYANKIVESPYFFISRSLEEQRLKYYDLLDGFRKDTREGYDEWVRFFLNAISKQAESDRALILNIDELFDETLKKSLAIARSNITPGFVTKIFEKPVFTIKLIAEELETSYDNVRNIVLKLEKEGIIRGNNKSRNKLYFNDKLLDLIAQ